MKIENIEKKINKMWSAGIKKDKTHKFFADIEMAENKLKNIRKNYAKTFKIKNYSNKIIKCKNNSNNNINLKTFTQKKEKFGKPLTTNEIIKIYKKINNGPIPSKKEITKIFEKFLNKPLPSNINLDKYLSKIKNSKNRNILIIGGGPTGMFVGLYLDFYYNRYENGISKSKKVNILVLDNRVVKEGFRKPFTRDRGFAYSTIYLNLIYQLIYCDTDHGGPINYIENLAYIRMFMNKIPMYFTDKYEDWNRYQKLIEKYNFEIVFDCTGNRLDVQLPKTNINLNNIQFKNKNNRELIITDTGIKFNTKIKNDPLMKMYYIKMYDKNKNYVRYWNLYTFNTCDINIYKKYKNKLIKKSGLIKINNLIKDEIDKSNIIWLTKREWATRNGKIIIPEYFMIDEIIIDMHHKLKVAHIYKYNKHKFLYIGAGDTIFHSHYVTGSGINRLFNFMVKCMNLIEI